MKRMINNNNVEELMIKVEELIHGKTVTTIIDQEGALVIPSNKIDFEKGVILNGVQAHHDRVSQVIIKAIPKLYNGAYEFGFVYMEYDNVEHGIISACYRLNIDSCSLNEDGENVSKLFLEDNQLFSPGDEITITYWETDSPMSWAV